MLALRDLPDAHEFEKQLHFIVGLEDHIPAGSDDVVGERPLALSRGHPMSPLSLVSDSLQLFLLQKVLVGVVDVDCEHFVCAEWVVDVDCEKFQLPWNHT